MSDLVRPQVLLVDDEQDLLDLFGVILGRLPCQLLKAAGGQEALNILATETPTLIVLDIAMPGVTGLDVLRAVRSDPRFDRTRIVVLTAVPIMLDRADAQLVNTILTKPITMLALDKAVRAALGL
ncbi:MAG: response regulator [Anaerolineae bacterium]|nr:response regulator [Anaerolineae bacterium]